MRLEDKIKQQNALEDDIAMSKDLSYELGKQIYKEFKELPLEKVLEYYDMMNSENDSLVRFDIFKDIILPNKEKLKELL
ncbi:hypothetical protein TROLL_200 [Bacillus phage Troll]|uniref:Uncharacterized protein n=3 Tax=Bequatrovirus TaxID=1917990 RepID=A0A075LYU4_9CAUD|nr:hypothetical protein TROLL_200 [Bacillus phage Troll]YP_009055957.1 hypothetical protein LD11_gp192 [Bacillus phage Riley]AGT13471.1 hypothetical protein TROLL_200 [Bacillus phage Troll]AIF72068.1 hypothetical protein [Bacillus phage Riley]ASZ75925.1 hypothetical protein TAFFO16_192 [Bacillus phage Taffo16]